jgi:hypothetical protein
MMGIPNEPISYQERTTNVPSPLFLAATEILAEDGYVKRLERLPGYPVKGIQITDKGLARAEFLKSRWSYRLKCFKNNLLKRVQDFYKKHQEHIYWGVIFAIIFAVIIEILKSEAHL